MNMNACVLRGVTWTNRIESNRIVCICLSVVTLPHVTVVWMTTTTTTGNDDAHENESTTGVFVVRVDDDDDDDDDTGGRRLSRVVFGRLGEHQKRVRGDRRGPTTYGSMVDGEDDCEDDCEEDDDLGLFVSSKEERRRTTRGARALATVGVAALAASGCGRALAAVRESGTSTMRSGYDKDGGVSSIGGARVDRDLVLRSVAGWDASTANQLARNFGRVGMRASRRRSRGASS